MKKRIVCEKTNPIFLLPDLSKSHHSLSVYDPQSLLTHPSQ